MCENTGRTLQRFVAIIRALSTRRRTKIMPPKKPEPPFMAILLHRKARGHIPHRTLLMFSEAPETIPTEGCRTPAATTPPHTRPHHDTQLRAFITSRSLFPFPKYLNVECQQCHHTAPLGIRGTEAAASPPASPSTTDPAVSAKSHVAELSRRSSERGRTHLSPLAASEDAGQGASPLPRLCRGGETPGTARATTHQPPDLGGAGRRLEKRRLCLLRKGRGEKKPLPAHPTSL